MTRSTSTVAKPRDCAQAQPPRAVWAAGSVALAASLLCWSPAPLCAQAPSVHYRFSGTTPPGAIGNWQLQRGGPLPGYFQPVEIRAPAGSLVSLAEQGAFDQPQRAPRLAGLLIAPVYRLRISHLPLAEGIEIYPTIEVIDRLYPPPGLAWRHPIPIDITPDDVRLALAGKFVTRVIYLEAPEIALPIPQPTDGINWFDAGAGENPLQVADALGRPVAILRLGGKLPADAACPDASFLSGSPPWIAPPCLPGRPATTAATSTGAAPASSAAAGSDLPDASFALGSTPQAREAPGRAEARR